MQNSPQVFVAPTDVTVEQLIAFGLVRIHAAFCADYLSQSEKERRIKEFDRILHMKEVKDWAHKHGDLPKPVLAKIAMLLEEGSFN